MIRRAIHKIVKFSVPCWHGQPRIVGGKTAAGEMEMYLACSVCRKRLSPGVVLSGGRNRYVPAQPAADDNPLLPGARTLASEQ